ncbi:MAG: iron-sulfur cluster assembly protein, partial [Methanomassiliicoccales archaeon]
MVSEDEVWAALDAVVDPELGVPMEGLELINDVIAWADSVGLAIT